MQVLDMDAVHTGLVSLSTCGGSAVSMKSLPAQLPSRVSTACCLFCSSHLSLTSSSWLAELMSSGSSVSLSLSTESSLLSLFDTPMFKSAYSLTGSDSWLEVLTGQGILEVTRNNIHPHDMNASTATQVPCRVRVQIHTAFCADMYAVYTFAQNDAYLASAISTPSVTQSGVQSFSHSGKWCFL